MEEFSSSSSISNQTKSSIQISLLKKNNDINEKLAQDLIKSLPKVPKIDTSAPRGQQVRIQI